MLDALLKPVLPRSLMGRAALILIVPVTGLLLVVSVAVVQRHYDRVTRQMTVEFARVVDHMRADLAGAADPSARLADLGAAFGIEARLDPAAPELREPWLPLYELSARVARRELRTAFPDRLALAVRPDRVTLALPMSGGVLVLEFPLARLTAPNPHQLLVLTLAAALLMTLIAYVFLRNQMRPIRRLARAAEAFGRGETLDLHVSGATEVRAAAHAFLDMRARIEAQIESRTLMLSGISHDLRTPLTRMRLALGLMDGEPEAAALTDDIAQMEAMIDRYLDFLRDGAAEPEAATDLAALVAERVALAARGGGTVALASGGAAVTVALRPGLFARALDNLIANALRYGTRAEVRLRAGPESVVIEVEDDGPGIPPAERSRALAPFVRLDGARAADGGVGLGLAIAADAMQRHGGRIELDSGATPGLGGLCARLVLPVQRSSSTQTGV
jgi:two-component system osmolarity sensor histidine kinase EnvZ